jgi:hypothetical protein
MGPIEGSETSANHCMTAGKYPEEHTQYSEHCESLKSGIMSLCIAAVVLIIYKNNHLLQKNIDSVVQAAVSPVHNIQLTFLLVSERPAMSYI